MTCIPIEFPLQLPSEILAQTERDILLKARDCSLEACASHVAAWDAQHDSFALELAIQSARRANELLEQANKVKG